MCTQKYHECSALMLSQNRIAHLAGTAQFRNLKQLSLSYNEVRSLLRWRGGAHTGHSQSPRERVCVGDVVLSVKQRAISVPSLLVMRHSAH